MKFQTYFLVIILLICGASAFADVDVSLELNQPYHGDGDILQVDVHLVNSGHATTVDLYVCLEVSGMFFFYPSFSQTVLDHKTFGLEEGQALSDAVIPPVVLPNDLPTLSCIFYGVAFSPGTWDIVSNIAMEMVHLQSEWQELPEPSYENTFYFMPGVDGLNYTSDQAEFDQVEYDLLTHFPISGLYFRHGVTILDPVSDDTNESKALEAANKVADTSLSLGFHVGVTCHHGYGEMENLRLIDRRNNQWDSDGSVFINGNDDLTSVTLSRYANDVINLRRNRAIAHGNAFAQALEQYPDSVVFVNGPIEVELRRAEFGNEHYADYSPFAVKEFRDWLRHSGIYADDGAEFSGKGVPVELIDNQDFSQDPAPNQSADRGVTFNDYFGTDFSSWSLQFWDPEIYPSPLSVNESGLPAEGEIGHTTGGFDPPRDNNGTLVGGNAKFQAIWDGWRTNQNYGNKTGFGFRQFSVHQYVEDNSRWLIEGGTPIERVFSHQIPVDFIGHWLRERSSASPFWTADNEFSNIGYTAYFDTTLQSDLFYVTQLLSPRWGLFEYHPDPFMQQPISYYEEALENLYRNRCQILVPLTLYSDEDGNYKLIGSEFEVAVNNFIQETWATDTGYRFDQPYFNDKWINYIPPVVKNVIRNGDRLCWSDYIWDNSPHLAWSDWGEFDYFEVHNGLTPDFRPNASTLLATTKDYCFTVAGTGYYKVLAVSKKGLKSFQ